MIVEMTLVNGRPSEPKNQEKHTDTHTSNIKSEYTTNKDGVIINSELTTVLKSHSIDQHKAITRLRRSISGYPITTPLIPVSSSVTSNDVRSRPVMDNTNLEPISESVSLRQSTLRNHLTGSVTYSSTESTSNEMTTLSADDIGINQLERFQMLTENVRLVVDSLFELMRTSEESSLEQIALVSDYPTLSTAVIENVKNCTHLQISFQRMFDLVYNYERRISRCGHYLFTQHSHQRSWVRRIKDVEQRLWSLLIDISDFVIPVPVIDEVTTPVEYITVLETLATLSVQSGVLYGVFDDLKRC